MSETEFDGNNNKLLNSDINMFSREEVAKCPHMMVLLGYLNQKHGIPRYGWLNNALRYHYTDAAGLLGIIQNNRLWATDFRFLNDPSEGSFLPERLLTLMASKSSGTTDTERKIIDGIKIALRNPRSDYATFCVSLSADGDLLSQWRGYGGFGKGYAIGLNLQRIPHAQIAHYYDVIYGDQGLPELSVDLLDLFVYSSDKWKGRMYDEWASTLSVIARSFKDKSYSEEKESRLVCSLPDEKTILADELPLRFRTNGSDIIPYVPMSLDFITDGNSPKLPIERIIVGPGVDFKRNFESIKALLEENSYENVKIEPSRIPFRP